MPDPRHVGLNLVFLVPEETGGMETYARELVPELRAALPSSTRLTTFVNRELGSAGLRAEGVDVVSVPVRARSRAAWVAGEQVFLPRLAHRAGCDLVHSLASTAPVRGAFRRVTTIHDTIFRTAPEAHFGMRALGMRVLVPAAARRSHRIIVPSTTTRDDLVRLYGASSNRVDVVPQGVRLPAPDAPALSIAEVRRRHDARDRPLVLSTSAKRPHKNLVRLLQALASFDHSTRPVLVLPGYPTPHEAELRELADDLGLGGDVRFPEWIAPEELEGLYRAADAFVFPSLYEGFGLPVLEALARGVPVACSNRASLPEVAGSAALFFDPEDPQAIADALRRLLAGGEEVERLRRAGPPRAASFGWERTAGGTIEAYRRALASSA